MIQYGKRVKIHYILKVDDEILESSEGKDPFEYVHGEDAIVPGLQKGLEGLKVGDRSEITVSMEEGFGPVDPEAFVQIPRSRLPKGNITLGTILTATGPSSETLRARVIELHDDYVILDFNHPLAGKELLFIVEVVEVA